MHLETEVRHTTGRLVVASWAVVAISLILNSGCQRTHVVDLNAGFALSPDEIDKSERAALAGDPNAAASLAFHYFMYERNATNGVRWLERAAMAGHTESQYNLAMLYLGEGPFHNAENATNWLTTAAFKGQPKAMLRLGLLLADGMVVKPDRLAAIKWLEQCLTRSNDLSVDEQQEAHACLACIYEEERGIPDAQKQGYLHALSAESLAPPETTIRDKANMVRLKIEAKLDQKTVQEINARVQDKGKH